MTAMTAVSDADCSIRWPAKNNLCGKQRDQESNGSADGQEIIDENEDKIRNDEVGGVADRFRD